MRHRRHFGLNFALACLAAYLEPIDREWLGHFVAMVIRMGTKIHGSINPNWQRWNARNFLENPADVPVTKIRARVVSLQLPRRRCVRHFSRTRRPNTA